jgi:hypothetical protein
VSRPSSSCGGCPRSRPSGAAPEGLAGVVELRPLFPGGPGGENASCARDQVVIARPPALTLTPPWRYRRFLVSKGRFLCYISINVQALRKAISRGDRLCRRPPPPPWQGRMLAVSWIMTRVRIREKTSCCLWVFVVVASDGPRNSPDGSKIVLKLGSQVSGVVETGVWTAAGGASREKMTG